MNSNPKIGRDYEFLKDKYILVTRDGDFYKLRQGEWVKCTITKVKGSSDYGIITQTIKGVQKTYYIHRLYAEAFLEKPNNHVPRYVMARDGNYFNLSIDNLYYGDDSDRITKIWEELYEQRIKCLSCGELHYGFKGKEVCPDCQYEINLYIKKLDTRQKRLIKIKRELDSVNLTKLSERDQKIYYMRREGKTLREIGERFDLTQERIRQILKTMIERN